MIIARKSLGQNFLRDDNVARNILDRLQLHHDDLLLEVGTGTGALTKHLAGKVERLLGVEIDQRAAETMRGRFGESVQVVQGDILSISLAEITARFGKKVRVVGNIPYYITSEILFWIYDQRDHVRDATLMMQLEVARRLTASPRTKDYGILSVLTQLYGSPELLFKVSRNSFYPRPNVDSAVVRLTIKDHVAAHNELLLRNIVRSTFGKRRKTILNGLKYMGFHEETLKTLPFDLRKRPEELGAADFLTLSGLLEEHLHEVPKLKFD
ncbi:MAG: ribosomal RNA small subunit methyltransferase A [Ignavibacteriales bacterium]|nr:ribosomal RNA small subunit methyltransferase A [Ignavibacteriales bacterium]